MSKKQNTTKANKTAGQAAAELEAKKLAEAAEAERIAKENAYIEDAKRLEDAAEAEAKKLAEARATLDAKDKSDCDACAKEIEAACNKWGCSMIARGQFAGNEIKTGISIVKKK